MRGIARLVFAALALSAASVSAETHDPRWTLSGQVGVSSGDQTAPSFSWRASLLRWRTPGAGIGLQFGRLRWEAREIGYTGADFGAPFEGLTQGGHELFDISGELRFRSTGEGAVAPFIALGAGGYRQNIRSAGIYAVPADAYRLPADSPDGEYHLGWHVAFGGMGLRTIAPGAEFRFDWIDSSPGPSAYFTASAALLLNR